MEEYAKRGYLLEDFRLFHLRTQRDGAVDYHYHEFCKLLLLVSGNGGYVVDGHRYLLQPGDVVLVGSRCVHRPELQSGGPYERIIIYIDPAFLERESSKDCDLAELFSGERGHVLRPSESASRKLLSMASVLERELSWEQYGREILSKAALLRLLVEVGQSLRQADARRIQPVTPQNSRILELKRYLDDHLAEDLDIDALSEAFYISKYHMMHQFRRETGSTIHTYLSRQRLLHARDLMKKGMRATEACYRSGFRSYSSFTRAYSKFFGTTPTGRAASGTVPEETSE